MGEPTTRSSPASSSATTTTASVGATGAARRKKRRLIGVGAAACALLAGGVALAWWLMARPGGAPSPTKAAPVDLVKFAGTPAFAQLPEEQKEPYLRAIQANLPAVIAAAQRGELSREERAAAVRNVMRARARLEARVYAGLADPATRRAHLDRLIDEQELLRKHDQRGEAAPNLVQMKAFFESLPPEERVRLAGMVFDLVKRRTERGLPPLPLPGPQPETPK